MASACVSLLSRDFCSPLKLANSNKPGAACTLRSDPKTVRGSKQCLKPTCSPVLSAKKLRKPRASTTPSTKLKSNSSSDKYGHPEVTSCKASVDLPLPDGPTIKTPLSLCGSTTPAL